MCSNEILVSISCITYNHAPYIRECLDGFMMQKTNFAFEVLIHDDASTDGTADIIREYEAKYPSIIKPIYEEENQWVKGRRGSAVFNFPRAKGKYIAMCEGDDYWTDPLKLQKQVDFLEANPEYVMCTHRFQTYEQCTKTLQNDWLSLSRDDNFYFDFEYFISRKEWVTQPLTILFRSRAFDLQHYSLYSKSKDVTLIYSLLQKGKGIVLRDYMGVYRIHNGGLWQGVNRVQQIKADMETCIGIYDVDKDKQSALLLKNSIHLFGYLGLSFLKDNFRMYKRIIKIIYKELGFIECMKILWHTNNYFHSYFGY